MAAVNPTTWDETDEEIQLKGKLQRITEVFDENNATPKKTSEDKVTLRKLKEDEKRTRSRLKQINTERIEKERKAKQKKTAEELKQGKQNFC